MIEKTENRYAATLPQQEVLHETGGLTKCRQQSERYTQWRLNLVDKNRRYI
ncbi:MAG: hypothetical protein LBG15_07560 [Dysgonamonadaceae bacterium]|jgi:hypothetical protein|nr:hypothetical protein [Dysgonamonadaceae bacterium]